MNIQRVTHPLLALVAVAALAVALAAPAGAWQPVHISVKAQPVCTDSFRQKATVEVDNPESQDAIVLSQLGDAFTVGQHIGPGVHDFTVFRAGTTTGDAAFEVTVDYPGDNTPRASNTVTVHFPGGCVEPTTTTTEPTTSTTVHQTTTTNSVVCSFTCNPDCFPNCTPPPGCFNDSSGSTSCTESPSTTAPPAPVVHVQPKFTG